MCARHIYGNLKKMFPHQGFKEAVLATIMEKNPKNCSLAFFTPTSFCVDVQNKISESFNNVIDPTRYIPMVEMLETIRRRTMVRIKMRKTKTDNHLGKLPSKIVEMIEMEREKLNFCKVVPRSFRDQKKSS
ncbi:unnamed protein product [Arabidopsis thaliana]|uniref:(thale cress) hypothetical protein n=1 Tax=Arabidopsis thaliana TaxID=3702 RepID=A0A7G2EUF2_ARATH|nr:unnamed protein product [Arabidopsis thaliana]